MLAPLTINRPIPFGVHRDGSPAAAELRDDCAVCVGQQGSGKTILLQNLTVGLLRCPDVLVWMVDLSEGGLSNPYVGPWRRGLTPDPVVDWLASDVDEALAMMAAAIRIINFRRSFYEEWMWDRDVDKLPLTHDLPAIILVLDEGKMATGISANPKLTRAITDISDRGRGMGVRLILSGLRGTAEVIPSELMAGIGARIGMKVAGKAECNYLFGWDMRPNPRDTPYPGCGLWRPTLAAGVPIPFRSHDLGSPKLISGLAQECLRWRPELDGPSLNEGLPDDLRERYASRWERAAGPRSREHGEPTVSQPGEHPSPGAHGSVSTAGRTGSPAAHARPGPGSPGREHGAHPGAHQSVSPMDRLTRGLDSTAVDQAFTRAKRALAAQAATTPDRLDATWSAIADALDADRAAGGEGWADARDPGARARLGQLLPPHGGIGKSGPQLRAALAAEGHDVPPATLYRWLRADAADGGYRSWTRHPDPEATPDDGESSQ